MATLTKFKWHKKKYERQVINSKFKTNPKSVYQDFMGKFNTNPKSVYQDFTGNNITLTNLPAKHEVEDFYNGIWTTETNFNKNAKWLKELEKTYCKKCNSKNL